MTKYHFNLCFLFSVQFFLFFLPSSALSSDKIDNNWSCTIQNGVEKSKRNYLLVYSPGTKGERKINIISQCQKPYPAEGVYGTCKHEIEIQPLKTRFTLNTGEDVVMISFTWDTPLILGTIAYGCCSGPDTARFYSDKGEYLGSVKGQDLSNRANNQNLIVRTFDMRNATRDKNKIYILVTKEDKDDEFQALLFENTEKPKSIPVLLSYPDRDKCEEWFIKDFVKYGDRSDITLKMEGHFCKVEGVEEQILSCSESEKGLICLSPPKITQ